MSFSFILIKTFVTAMGKFSMHVASAAILMCSNFTCCTMLSAVRCQSVCEEVPQHMQRGSEAKWSGSAELETFADSRGVRYMYSRDVGWKIVWCERFVSCIHPLNRHSDPPKITLRCDKSFINADVTYKNLFALCQRSISSLDERRVSC